MVVLLLMMTTSRTRRTKAVNLALVLINWWEWNDFSTGATSRKWRPSHIRWLSRTSQNQMLLSIQKFPPVIKLYFRIVCDPNMNYKVAPPFEGRDRKCLCWKGSFLVESKWTTLPEVTHSKVSWMGVNPPSPRIEIKTFMMEVLFRTRRNLIPNRWTGILSSLETQFYTSVGITSGQGQRSATFKPWFSKEHSSQTFR